MNSEPDHLKNGQPDEALLTAYALGELNRSEQVVVEASLAGSADARRRVEEIRALAAVLWQAARGDTPAEASLGLREVIERHFQERDETEEAEAMEAKPVPPPVVRPYRNRRRWLALAAAASLLIAAIPVAYRYLSPFSGRDQRSVALTWPQAADPASQEAADAEGEIFEKSGAYASKRDAGPADNATVEVLARPLRVDASGPRGEGIEVKTRGAAAEGMSAPGVFSADLDVPLSADDFGFDSPQAGGLPLKPAPSDAQPPVDSLAGSAAHGASRGAISTLAEETNRLPTASPSPSVKPPTRRYSSTSPASQAMSASGPSPTPSVPAKDMGGPGRGLTREAEPAAAPLSRARIVDSYGYEDRMEGMEEIDEALGEAEVGQKVAPGDGLAVTAPAGPTSDFRMMVTPRIVVQEEEEGRTVGAEYGSGMGGGMGGGMMGGSMGYGGSGRAAGQDAMMGSGGRGVGGRYGESEAGQTGLGSAPQAQPAKSVGNGLPGPYGRPLTPYVPQQGLARNLREPVSGELLGVAGTEIIALPALDVEVLRRREESRQVELRSTFETLGTEQYDPITENEFLPVDQKHAKSTFSVDVDTASYANVRRFLTEGRLPPPGAVRIEELINYFQYDYPLPDGEVPFSVDVETAQCPWTPGHRLVRIGIKGQEVQAQERGPGNLVFLLDVSGSMSDADKLPLVKQAMTMLVDQLTEDDRVGIVTYAGSAGVVLEPTRADEPDKIRRAIEALSAGGSTHGSAGIMMAYDQAMRHYEAEGTNRVILCTDGDLNVGITDDDQLVQLITQQAKSGVFLTVLGFGTGNLKDSKMEKLADKGNGIYAYVDGLREARRVLVEQVSGSLVTIAKDVKIQIEFNPAEVAAYRLIGYENRVMAAKDFANDKKDAGEIGAGHTVTALYELVPAGAETSDVAAADRNLKYQRTADKKAELTKAARSGELFTLALRYKLPDGDTSRLLEYTAKDSGHRFGQASDDFRFASAVAAFGMLLRGSQYGGDLTFSAAEEFAAGAAGNDPGGYRGQFVELVRQARQLRAGQGSR